MLICSDYLAPHVKGALPVSDLDILCIPAFQNNSQPYYENMQVDCTQSEDGLYIAYANTWCPGFGDGRTALFGLLDRAHLEQLVTHGFTDGSPSRKACELKRGQDSIVATLDLDKKRPTIAHTVVTVPNIRLFVTTEPAPRDPARDAAGSTNEVPGAQQRHSSSGEHEAGIARGEFDAALVNLYGPSRVLIGRGPDLRQLGRAWSSGDVAVIIVSGFAGEGKSALAGHWVMRAKKRLSAETHHGTTRVYGYSFYHQGTSERHGSADDFLNSALT